MSDSSVRSAAFTESSRELDAHQFFTSMIGPDSRNLRRARSSGRVEAFYIVSVVTAIGAIASGRGIEDLLIPMGQMRDSSGRIIGATSLAPATSLLSPMYRAIVAPYQAATLEALRERNEARALAAVITRAPDASPDPEQPAGPERPYAPIGGS